jgi:hypothetical protein
VLKQSLPSSDCDKEANFDVRSWSHYRTPRQHNAMSHRPKRWQVAALDITNHFERYLARQFCARLPFRSPRRGGNRASLPSRIRGYLQYSGGGGIRTSSNFTVCVDQRGLRLLFRHNRIQIIDVLRLAQCGSDHDPGAH